MAQERDISASSDSGPVDPKTLLSACYDQSWAVVIGINDYRHVAKLEYARADAEAVVAALADIGFPRGQIVTLLDGQATRQNIQDMISVDLARKTTPNDSLFVFFAGHGQDYTDPSGRKMGFFLPVDSDPAWVNPRQELSE